MRAFATLILLLYSVILSAQERVTLLFAGDLMQHRRQIEAARTPVGDYDYTPCFARVESLIKSADIAIGNLEETFGGTPYTGYPCFSAPDSYLQAIKSAGFDVLLTANNHCLDRRKRGLHRTIALLDSLDMPHAGTYRDSSERANRYPLLLRHNDIRIALLAYTYATNGIPVSPPNIVNLIDTALIRHDIATARAMRPDVIIACMHWGDEYVSLPNRTQKQLADWLLAQGVDHIIGTHPHVVQPAEIRATDTGRHVIAYSLGNFLSDMSARDTDGGMILSLTLDKDTLSGETSIADCSYRLVWTGRPILTGKENYALYLIGEPGDSLTHAAYKRMAAYTERTRRLLDRYNVGIYENISYKKSYEKIFLKYLQNQRK